MAGIHFTVINFVTKKPLIEAVITTGESPEAYAVNEWGMATILMKGDVHSITVLCPGFDTYTGVAKTDAGVKHRVKIKPVKRTIALETADMTFTRETALEQ